MAAEGTLFSLRWDGGTISLNLRVIREISVNEVCGFALEAFSCASARRGSLARALIFVAGPGGIAPQAASKGHLRRNHGKCWENHGEEVDDGCALDRRPWPAVAGNGEPHHEHYAGRSCHETER